MRVISISKHVLRGEYPISMQLRIVTSVFCVHLFLFGSHTTIGDEHDYLDTTLPDEVTVAPYVGEHYRDEIPDTLDQSRSWLSHRPTEKVPAGRCHEKDGCAIRLLRSLHLVAKYRHHPTSTRPSTSSNKLVGSGTKPTDWPV